MPDDDRDMMTVQFSAAELATIDELVEDLRELYDPDMDRDRLLGQIQPKAVEALLADVESTRGLFARALFVVALKDWKAFGLGPFCERWLA